MEIIKRATWGRGHYLCDVTEIVKRFITKTVIHQSLFPIDPCPHVVKSLIVEYNDCLETVHENSEFFPRCMKDFSKLQCMNVPSVLLPLDIPPRTHRVAAHIKLHHPPEFNIIPIYKSISCLQLNVRKLDYHQTFDPVEIEIEDLKSGKKTTHLCSSEIEYVDLSFEIFPLGSKQTAIPKHIIQTRNSRIVSVEAYKCILGILDWNPDYSYSFYDDNRVYNFISDIYGSDSREIQTLERLEPGAFRADLFRYMILYHQGGVYLDCKQVWHVPFDSIITEETTLELVEDAGRPRLGCFNAVIFASRNQEVFNNCIKTIVSNQHNNILHPDFLAVTGPRLLAVELYKTYIDFAYRFRFDLIDPYIFNKSRVMFNDIEICYTFYPDYLTIDVHNLNSLIYRETFMSGNTYKKASRTTELSSELMNLPENVKDHLVAMKFRNVSKIYWKDGYLYKDGTLRGEIPPVFLV